MKHEQAARRAKYLRHAQRAVLVAHLDAFGGVEITPPRDKGRCGTRFYQIARGLEAQDLLRIENMRSTLTEDGRAVLAAVISSWIEIVVGKAERPREMVLHYRSESRRDSRFPAGPGGSVSPP